MHVEGYIISPSFQKCLSLEGTMACSFFSSFTDPSSQVRLKCLDECLIRFKLQCHRGCIMRSFHNCLSISKERYKEQNHHGYSCFSHFGPRHSTFTYQSSGSVISLFCQNPTSDACSDFSSMLFCEHPVIRIAAKITAMRPVMIIRFIFFSLALMVLNDKPIILDEWLGYNNYRWNACCRCTHYSRKTTLMPERSEMGFSFSLESRLEK